MVIDGRKVCFQKALIFGVPQGGGCSGRAFSNLFLGPNCLTSPAMKMARPAVFAFQGTLSLDPLL